MLDGLKNMSGAKAYAGSGIWICRQRDLNFWYFISAGAKEVWSNNDEENKYKLDKNAIYCI